MDSQTKTYSPIFNAKGYAVEGNHVISSMVTILVVARIPFYITRFISFIVINSFDCMRGGRTLADVINKRLKTTSPQREDGYSPSTVVFIGRIIGVASALYHAVPNTIFRSARQVVGTNTLFLIAATGLNVTAFNVIRSNIFDSSTNAKTFPRPYLFIGNGFYRSKIFSKYSQSTEYFTNVILGYNLLTRHVHSRIANVLTRALGLFPQSQGPFILARSIAR